MFMSSRFLQCVKVLNNEFASSFVLKIRKTATETYQLLQQAFGEDAVGRTQVFDWFRQFKERTTSVRDNRQHRDTRK